MRSVRIVLLAAAVFGLATAAYAKPAKDKKKPETSAPAEVQAPAVPVRLEVSSPPVTSEDVVRRFEAIDRQITSLRAKYQQTVHFEETGTTQTIEGRIQFLKPERLRIEHTRPERQTVVSDGKAIWVHRHSSNQVIQSDLADWRKADPMVSSLLDFGGYSSLGKRYDVEYSSPTREVTLTPKDKSAGFAIKMRLEEGTWFPSETELSVAQMKVRTSLKDVEFNLPLPESEFEFKPPPGADVFRNFKPPRLSP